MFNHKTQYWSESNSFLHDLQIQYNSNKAPASYFDDIIKRSNDYMQGQKTHNS